MQLIGNPASLTQLLRTIEEYTRLVNFYSHPHAFEPMVGFLKDTIDANDTAGTTAFKQAYDYLPISTHQH
jgi:hypothetical protein